MSPKNKTGFATRATGMGRPQVTERTTVNPPVYRASTILFPSVDEFERAYCARLDDDNYIYGRLGTPSGNALRAAWADLENGFGCVLTSCGLSAVSTALLAFLSRGDHLLMPDTVYAPVRTFCDAELTRFGIDTTYYDPTVGGDIASLLRDNTRVIYLESPGSVTFEVQDVPAIVTVAAARGIVTVADNTWATPYFFRPLDVGVNVSLQAATKYVGGHSDALMGMITTDREHYDAVHRLAVNAGEFAAADEVALMLRGLRTLAVRLDRHYENAVRVAEHLRGCVGVRRVIYPALRGDDGYELWQRDFCGAPGLFSIVLEPRPCAALGAFVDNLRHFGIGVSWGGYESLAMPADPRTIRTATEWRDDGQLLRLHIGLEDVADLIADLDDGLARYVSYDGAGCGDGE